MSVRGWGGPIATAIGCAVMVGAAQLGLGYGLGIIDWHGDGASRVAALAWAMWAGAFAVVAGAVMGHRALTTQLAVAPDGDSTVLGRALWRITIALAATLGGLVVVPLTALPAGQMTADATSTPDFAVGWHAVVGVLIGLIMAILALSSHAIAANLITTGAWWWLIALVAMTDAVAGGRGLIPTPLGAWRFTGGGPDTVPGTVTALELPDEAWWTTIYLPGAALVVGAAFVIGALAAMPTARNGNGWVGVALSGAAGPALLAAVLLLASPRLTEAPTEQLSALLIAPYAVLAGLLGSVAVALIVDHAGRPKPLTV